MDIHRMVVLLLLLSSARAFGGFTDVSLGDLRRAEGVKL